MAKEIQVHKFGGASIKDADGIKNVARIIKAHSRNNLIVVVSAMGKTTNALEEMVKLAYEHNDAAKYFHNLFQSHQQTCRDLGISDTVLEPIADSLLASLNPNQGQDFDSFYDEVIAHGELLASQIVFSYLKSIQNSVTWLDARTLIRTDAVHRSATADVRLCRQSMRSVIMPIFEGDRASCIITQGFIGSETSGRTTTLGREGSDYSAAICAHCTEATSLTIWKDVPGVLNADPKKNPEALLLSHINYNLASEMTYYGAQVIHPKTLKPLADLGISLHVRSYLNPDKPGTTVDGEQDAVALPIFIEKSDIHLITVQTADFSFMNETNIGAVISQAAAIGARPLLIQQSALDVSLVVPADINRADRLVESLKLDGYKVNYNSGLTLVTLRGTSDAAKEKSLAGRQVLLSQHSRRFSYYVVSPTL